MDTIKKNLGFVIISLICFICVGYLIVTCRGTNKKLTDVKTEYENNFKYLDGVGKEKLKLTAENVQRAQKNSELTTQGINDVHKKLMEHYKLTYKVPQDGASALRELRDSINSMTKFVTDNEIILQPKVSAFSFDKIANDSAIPDQNVLDPLSRALALVKRVVDIAVQCKVKSIDEINRPMNLGKKEEANYTLTPIEITVTASPENGQNFINAMSSQDNALFFLRKIEIVAPDVESDVGKEVLTSDTSSRSQYMEGNEGVGMTRMEREPRRKERLPKKTNARLVDIPKKRQENLVYEAKDVTLKLRFDFIEPNYQLPEEPKAE